MRSVLHMEGPFNSVRDVKVSWTSVLVFQVHKLNYFTSVPSLNHFLPGFQPSDWFNPSPLIGPIFSSVHPTDINCSGNVNWTANQAEGRELSRDRKQRRHSYMNGPYYSLPLYCLSTTRLGGFHLCDSSESSPFQPSDWVNLGPLIGGTESSVRPTDINCSGNIRWTANQAEGRELSRDRKQRRHSYMNGPYYSWK